MEKQKKSSKNSNKKSLKIKAQLKSQQRGDSITLGDNGMDIKGINKEQQNNQNYANKQLRKKHSCKFRVLRDHFLNEKYFRTHLDVIITEDYLGIEGPKMKNQFFFNSLNYYKRVNRILNNKKLGFIDVELDSLVVKKLPFKILLQRLNNCGTEHGKKFAFRIERFNQNLVAMIDQSKPKQRKNSMQGNGINTNGNNHNNSFDQHSLVSLDTLETSFHYESHTQFQIQHSEFMQNCGTNNQNEHENRLEQEEQDENEEDEEQRGLILNNLEQVKFQEERKFKEMKQKQGHQKDLKYIERVMQKNSKRATLAILYECNKEKYDLKIKHLIFNKVFYTLLGQNEEYFSQYLMKCGFPEVYQSNSYFQWWMDRMDKINKQFRLKMNTFDGINFECTETRKAYMGESNLITIQYFDNVVFQESMVQEIQIKNQAEYYKNLNIKINNVIANNSNNQFQFQSVFNSRNCRRNSQIFNNILTDDEDDEMDIVNSDNKNNKKQNKKQNKNQQEPEWKLEQWFINRKMKQKIENFIEEKRLTGIKRCGYRFINQDELINFFQPFKINFQNVSLKAPKEIIEE